MASIRLTGLLFAAGYLDISGEDYFFTVLQYQVFAFGLQLASNLL